VPARYIEIADELRRRIRDGMYPIGSKLPTIAQMQAEFEVRGLNTIRSAYAPLIAEGLLRGERGVGVWVLAAPPPRDMTVADALNELRMAHRALGNAIVALEGQS
jgi:DNA-binding GntR family transcriptional regulator